MEVDPGSRYLHFWHRYNFDSGDGGTVFFNLISITGSGDSGPYLAQTSSFALNPYNSAALTGNHDLFGLPGFTGKSPGYDDGEFIKSTIRLGYVNERSFTGFRFVGAWDEFSSGQGPNWEITRTELSRIPEPSTYAMLATAALIVGASCWHRRSRRYARLTGMQQDY
jgi:hypothetical protein